MKRIDHVLAMTKALLTSAKFDQAVSIISSYSEINEPRKSGFVSLGAWQSNVSLSLLSWIKALRGTGIQSVVCVPMIESDEMLAPHIRAGFAGPSDLLLQITSNNHVLTFGLNTFYSPAYTVTPAQFIILINAQEQRDVLWNRIAVLINESNRLNSVPEFPHENVQEYILSEHGASIFSFQIDDLLREVQVESSIQNTVFTIPELLVDQFIKYDNMFGDADGGENFYLYPLRQVTVDELMDLVNAQVTNDLWSIVADYVQDDPYADERLKNLSRDEWAQYLSEADDEDIMQCTYIICRVICMYCEKLNIRPIIPDELKDAFGPDEIEHKRANARSKIERSRWHLRPNENTWEYYEFFPVEGVPLFEQQRTEVIADEFIQALREAQEFAAQINSDFEEVFILASFVHSFNSNHDTWEETYRSIREALEKNNFSERACQVLDSHRWMGEMFESLEWTQKTIQALFSVSIADVFGGMGSWNDQDGDYDEEAFSLISQRLYASLRNYLGAILSSELNEL